MSGCEIIATEDHKFMSIENGILDWKKVKDIDLNTTAIGILNNLSKDNAVNGVNVVNVVNNHCFTFISIVSDKFLFEDNENFISKVILLLSISVSS